MQCGHDCCRHSWWNAGKFSWCSVDWDKPVVCVIHDPVTQPAWKLVIKPPNFIPYQNAEMPKKKLMPCRRRVTMDHVVNVHGTGLTATQRTAKITEINKESLAAVEWGREQVKQRMMFAMTRVGLKVGGRHARNFSDVKNSLRQVSSNPNIARIFETCYGDCAGSKIKPFGLAGLDLSEFWDLQHFKHTNGQLLNSSIAMKQQPIGSAR
jgi:hypothetical protein